MLCSKILAILLVTTLVVAQTTYTGCHNHSSVEWCYGPNGEETPLITYSATASSTLITSTTPAANSAEITTTATGQTTAITSCHAHETEIACINGNGDEVFVDATATGEVPAQYTGCHAHETEQFCLAPDGSEVLVLAVGVEPSDASGNGSEGESETEGCHFHAGVEHCPGQASSCGLRVREYNVPLRIGTLFAVLVTSSIGVFAPIFLARLPFQALNGTLLSIVKQFGTGVIISTAFIHLYTHAYLMFTNECLGELSYEATTSAIVMAGIFLSFLIEFLGHRFITARSQPPTVTNKPNDPLPDSSDSDKPLPQSTSTPAAPTLLSLGHHHTSPFSSSSPNSKLSVLVMEAGIIFHSVLIGLTLVVAGDSFYITLFIVIVFHQFFEGLALGARIALLPSKHVRMLTKLLMATAFALITPLGMAIGLGVLNRFNGNDSTTIIVIGTLDALSAGILVWVGVVDMWARDWIIEGGEMCDASLGRVCGGGLALVSGMVLMGVLGKWA